MGRYNTVPVFRQQITTKMYRYTNIFFSQNETNNSFPAFPTDSNSLQVFHGICNRTQKCHLIRCKRNEQLNSHNFSASLRMRE